MLDRVKGAVEPGAVRELARRLGEDEESVARGLDGAFGAVLGGIAARSSEPGFTASSIWRA